MMNMNVIIPANLARKNLGELLNQAYYQGTPFLVTRGKKAMAAVIGAKEFQAFLIYLEKNDPGMADTLAIMSNPEIEAILAEGEKDVKADNLIPLEEVLNE
jgi:PHD/YefM family antitoxin component YafN of YafNO toxin-antitoxin module